MSTYLFLHDKMGVEPFQPTALLATVRAVHPDMKLRIMSKPNGHKQYEPLLHCLWPYDFLMCNGSRARGHSIRITRIL